MDGRTLKRLLVGVAGAFSVVAVLFALLMFLNREWGFAGCTGTTAFGWLLPPLAGLLIGGVAWALLFHAPNYTEDDEGRHSIPCPTCDKAVMADWRMCPYCGRVLPLERPQVSEQHG